MSAAWRTRRSRSKAGTRCTRCTPSTGRAGTRSPTAERDAIVTEAASLLEAQAHPGRRAQRVLLAADAEGRSLPHALAPGSGGAPARRGRVRADPAARVPPADVLLSRRRGARDLRAHRPRHRDAGAPWPRARRRRLRRRAHRGDAEDRAAAPLPRVPARALPLLLSDVEASRRARELVRPAGDGALRLHARSRRDRTASTPARSCRSSRARSDWTTGNGASRSSPTIRSSSRS